MKIASIEAFPLEYPEPHYKGTLRYITLAKVTDDDGTAGWGECISQFPEAALATATTIEWLCPSPNGRRPAERGGAVADNDRPHLVVRPGGGLPPSGSAPSTWHSGISRARLWASR